MPIMMLIMKTIMKMTLMILMRIKRIIIINEYKVDDNDVGLWIYLSFWQVRLNSKVHSHFKRMIAKKKCKSTLTF